MIISILLIDHIGFCIIHRTLLWRFSPKSGLWWVQTSLQPAWMMHGWCARLFKKKSSPAELAGLLQEHTRKTSSNAVRKSCLGATRCTGFFASVMWKGRWTAKSVHYQGLHWCIPTYSGYLRGVAWSIAERLRKHCSPKISKVPVSGSQDRHCYYIKHTEVKKFGKL